MNALPPPQTPEGRLIEKATKDSGHSARSLAANAGMSDTRWRQIVRGHQPGPSGAPIPVHAPARTIARMALVLGLHPNQLEDVDRQDAADLLVRMLEGKEVRSVAESVRLSAASNLSVGSPTPVNDQITLIYESTTMSPVEKLDAIRKVLELNAQVEAQGAATLPALTGQGEGVVETRPQVKNNG